MPHKHSSTRGGRGYKERKVETREQRSKFLIVCEGSQTEPNYFKGFRVPKDVIEINIIGLGMNPTQLVEYAIERKLSPEDYDQVWCVFDRDDFTLQDFNNAFQIAKKNDVRIAYSNEAFELWYLLHFNLYTTGITRQAYITRLTNLLGYRYEKNSPTIYRDLLQHQNTAIKNAKRLLQQYDPHQPAHNNPSTTVYLLVEELNKYMP